MTKQQQKRRDDTLRRRRANYPDDETQEIKVRLAGEEPERLAMIRYLLREWSHKDATDSRKMTIEKLLANYGYKSTQRTLVAFRAVTKLDP